MSKHDKNELKKNGSGCSDPTAYAAIMKVSRNGNPKKRHREQDVSDAMHIIKRFLEIIDFEIDGRVVLTDKQTGIKYK